ncbi:MAG: peptide chain release factor 1 [Gammaproteobacteria bacterium]|jgi:peptide chain release factor 1|nr:peptide chain release factor 1 [Gammaproteobacteria bacterium]
MDVTPGILEKIIPRLQSMRDRFDELSGKMASPEIARSPDMYRKLARDQAELAPVVELYDQWKRLRKEQEELDLIRDDPQMAELVSGEDRRLREVLEGTELRLVDAILPKDQRDERNLFIEIRAGAGGEEAALFAAELGRMYLRFVERQGFRAEVMESNETDIGGSKEFIIYVQGRNAFSRLKYESGVHRVQRVPVTEAGGRIHTSTVTVAILPEASEVEVDIEQKDLRIDTFCSSGAGGQSVNTTYSAVRITHIPSGIVVSCQDERSQLKNRTKAMSVLRSRLLEQEVSRQNQEIASQRKTLVGSGDRSERIRTYNFPQNRVTDHRIGLTLYQLDRVMEGELEPLVDALRAHDRAEEIKNIS